MYGLASQWSSEAAGDYRVMLVEESLIETSISARIGAQRGEEGRTERYRGGGEQFSRQRQEKIDDD